MANSVPKFSPHQQLGGRFSANEAVERGVSQIGVKYSWGGDSPSGFDCSGFVSWCYWGGRKITSAMGDNDLNHYKFQHYSYSKGPEKGDILYFPPVIGTGDALHPNKPGHVGIFTGDECKHFGYPKGGPVLQSTGIKGVGFWEHSSWTDIQRPKQGYGVYIDHFN